MVVMGEAAVGHPVKTPVGEVQTQQQSGARQSWSKRQAVCESGQMGRDEQTVESPDDRITYGFEFEGSKESLEALWLGKQHGQ